MLAQKVLVVFYYYYALPQHFPARGRRKEEGLTALQGGEREETKQKVVGCGLKKLHKAPPP